MAEFGGGFTPTYTVGTEDFPSRQRGGLIPETGLYMMHRHEKVSSSNKEEVSTSADVVVIESGSWEEFTRRLWRDFGIKARRENGRYML